MEIWKVKKTKIRLEYPVIEKGSPDRPYEEAVELTVEQTIVETGEAQKKVLEKALLGLEVDSEDGQAQYVLYRRQSAFKFDFDENESVLPLHGGLKIVLTLQRKLGEDFTDTAYYPISPENDLLITESSQLSAKNLKFLVTGTGEDCASPPYELYVFSQEEPHQDKCSGCYSNPQRNKRIQCALDGCYSY